MTFLATRGDDLNQERAFALMAAFDTNEAVIKAFAEEGIETTDGVLDWLRHHYPDRLEKARQAMVPAKEMALTNGMLDNTVLVNEALTVAIKLAKDRLDAGACENPAKTGRDLADILAKLSDKRLSLEGRPTSFTQDRSASDIMRALEAKGVVVEVEPITDAEVIEND